MKIKIETLRQIIREEMTNHLRSSGASVNEIFGWSKKEKEEKQRKQDQQKATQKKFSMFQLEKQQLADKISAAWPSGEFFDGDLHSVQEPVWWKQIADQVVKIIEKYIPDAGIKDADPRGQTSISNCAFVLQDWQKKMKSFRHTFSDEEIELVENVIEPGLADTIAAVVKFVKKFENEIYNKEFKDMDR